MRENIEELLQAIIDDKQLEYLSTTHLENGWVETSWVETSWTLESIKDVKCLIARLLYWEDVEYRVKQNPTSFMYMTRPYLLCDNIGIWNSIDNRDRHEFENKNNFKWLAPMVVSKIQYIISEE